MITRIMPLLLAALAMTACAGTPSPSNEAQMGVVEVECTFGKVADGAPSDCVVISETPENAGLGAQALEVAQQGRIRLRDRHAEGGDRARFKVHFQLQD